MSGGADPKQRELGSLGDDEIDGGERDRDSAAALEDAVEEGIVRIVVFLVVHPEALLGRQQSCMSGRGGRGGHSLALAAHARGELLTQRIEDRHIGVRSKSGYSMRERRSAASSRSSSRSGRAAYSSASAIARSWRITRRAARARTRRRASSLWAACASARSPASPKEASFSRAAWTTLGSRRATNRGGLRASTDRGMHRRAVRFYGSTERCATDSFCCYASRPISGPLFGGGRPAFPAPNPHQPS